MILYEFEGKDLLLKYGIKTPKSQVVSSIDQKVKISKPFFAKAQVLSGKRKEAGGIIEVKENKNPSVALKKLVGSVVNKEKVEKVLLEEATNFKEEYYVSLSYDTDFRGPVITFSQKGGTGIETRKSIIFPVDILSFKPDYPKGVKISSSVENTLPKLAKLFFEEDATLVEVNPLVVDTNGKVVALDAKIKLDDSAAARHPERDYPARSVPGHTVTRREIAAKKIDEGDHKGTAGSTYFDLVGDIAVLASGGGGSLAAMDALLALGGRPANYTEYSGNPPKEKVEKLTQVVLSKPGLNGLWVVGAVANFTDIYATLTGFLEALRKVKPKPKYPIVIRRGGPRDKEVFEKLRKVKDFDLHLYGEEVSITASAEIITKLAKKYATSS